MATVHRLGFTRLSADEQDDDGFCLNIVFVHGLRGHPRATWEAASASNGSSNTTKKRQGLRSFFKRRTARPSVTDAEQAQPPTSVPSPPPSATVFWPGDFLAVDIPQARVWTYGYNADVIGGLFQANNQNSISQHGRDLSVRLEREIDNGKPLAFVVHSLGGIIVKDALHRSEIARNQTKLIIFLGTPHRGSAYAGWGQIASNLARLALQDSNKKILETLEVNGEVLDNIHDEFKTIAFKGGIKIHSFQEARGIAGVKGLHGKVVDDFSSKLDLPRTLETVESVDADHMRMTRYNSKGDQGYRAISGVVQAFVREELENQQTPSAEIADVPSHDALFLVPFSRDSNFVGRKNAIAEISKHQAVLRRHTRLALVGLGGVGKSQIAIEYAYRIRSAKPRTLVLWIHASNPTKFQQGYRDIAKKLLLHGWEDPKVDVLQLVHAWLSDRRNGPWLLILDNVDDDHVFFTPPTKSITGPVQTIDETDYSRPLERFLPQTENGSILITSRNKAAAMNLTGGSGKIVDVKSMGQDEALELLRTRVPYAESNLADAKALVQELDHIPLAIAHAAAYIKIRAPTMTISTYLKLFLESEANQTQLLSKKEWIDIRRDESTRDAVIATWQISFKHIQETEPSAADLLAMMSMFDKQGIPRWLLQADTSELHFNDALAPLISFSLVRAEIGEQVLGMHRLVQLSMRTWLKAEKQLSRWVKESAQAMNAAFPSGEYGTWEKCKVLLPHVKEIVSHTVKDDKDSMNQAESALRAGWYLYLMCEYDAAADLVWMVVDTSEKILGREHPNTLASLGQLGLVLISQGKYKEAEAMLEQVLQGQQKVLGLEHPDTLISLSHLGFVLLRQEKYKEAEAMLQHALQGQEKVLGPEHPETLATVTSLAVLAHRKHLYPAACQLYQRAYEGHLKAYGAQHPDTVKCLSHYELAMEERELDS